MRSRFRSKKFAAVFATAFVLSSCSHIPFPQNFGDIEIRNVKDAVECEVAAVALNKEFDEETDIADWNVKSNLYLPLSLKATADGKATWVVPNNPLIKIVPTPGIGRSDKAIGQLDFITNIKAVKSRFRDSAICDVDSHDPSGTGIGLAIWLGSTLREMVGNSAGSSFHAGTGFTSEFEITSSFGSRFGWSVTRLDADIGFNLSKLYNNRLVVAVTPPQQQSKPKPIKVIIVGDRTKQASKNGGEQKDSKQAPSDQKGKDLESFTKQLSDKSQRITDVIKKERSKRRTITMPPYNPSQENLLQRQAPIRIEPGL